MPPRTSTCDNFDCTDTLTRNLSIVQRHFVPHGVPRQVERAPAQNATASTAHETSPRPGALARS